MVSHFTPYLQRSPHARSAAWPPTQRGVGGEHFSRHVFRRSMVQPGKGVSAVVITSTDLSRERFALACASTTPDAAPRFTGRRGRPPDERSLPRHDPRQI